MTSRLLCTLVIALAGFHAAPASAEDCVAASIFNKGTYILHFRGEGRNEKCSADTRFDVAGAGTANMDVTSGNSVAITGLFCDPDIAKCFYRFVCDEENSCEDIVCDGVFPGSLHCKR